MASISSPPQAHFPRSVRPVFEPLESISSYPSHLVRWRECADSRFKLTSYVFIGQRTNNLPVRMAFVAGLRSHDELAQRALAKLLVELEVAPLVGSDYALFSYSLTRESNNGIGETYTNDRLDESSGVQPILQVLEVGHG